MFPDLWYPVFGRKRINLLGLFRIEPRVDDISKTMSSSENMSLSDETSPTLMLPTMTCIFSQGSHPRLLTNVNVKVVALDVWMGQSWLTTFYKSKKIQSTSLTTAKVPVETGIESVTFQCLILNLVEAKIYSKSEFGFGLIVLLVASDGLYYRNKSFKYMDN